MAVFNFLSTRLASDQFAIPSASSMHHSSQDHLTGLRGCLVIQSFLFVFFQTFVPAAVVDANTTDGPLYAIILRKTISVLFWNESLIYSWVILLSARTICLPYLLNPEKEACASSIFKRGVRLWIPTFIAFSISAALFSKFSTFYINEFLRVTGNKSIRVPVSMRTFLVYFNSVFDLFWITRDYSAQAANQIFPSGTLWAVSVIFQQSYTVYMTMITIQHTRTRWRVQAFGLFIITAWWVQSWAWYSITGLLLADAVENMGFKGKSKAGWRLGGRRIPMWPLYATCITAGWLLQYLFAAWRPEYRNKELQGHTGLYNSEGLNEGIVEDQPQARDDNFLIILGVMLLVETYETLQRLLKNVAFVELGKRSLSIFLVQPLMVYTAGIRLYLHLHARDYNHEVATLICFVTSLVLVALVSEIFYRMIDMPSVAIASSFWAWMRR